MLHKMDCGVSSVAFLGDDPLAAAGNPSPLSIPWGIDEYFDTLAAAL